MIWSILAVLFLVIFAVSTIIFLFSIVFDWDTLSEISIKALVISLVPLIICVLIAATLETEKEKSACSDIGGTYEIVGTETAYMMVGKVMVPNEVNVYGCIKE